MVIFFIFEKWEKYLLHTLVVALEKQKMIIKEENYENDPSVLFVLSQTGAQEMVISDPL